MFSFLNPWLIIGAICAVLGVYFYGHHAGYQERVAEDQAEIIRLNDEARAKEVELNAKVKNLSKSLQKATNEIISNKSALNARVDSGELRLPFTCPVQANSGSTTGDRNNASQSERETVKALIAIAADGDIAINNLNSCIAQYNEVMKTVNEGVK
jgi:hypothetical protein